MFHKALCLAVLRQIAGPIYAKDLILKPKTQVPSGFIRLAQLVEDSREAASYQDVWLGKAPEEKAELLSIDFIQSRLRRSGFITINPVVSNKALTVEVSPLLVQKSSMPLSLPQMNISTQTQPEPVTPLLNAERIEYTYLALKESQSRGVLLNPDMLEPIKEKRLIEDAFVLPEDVIGYRLERSLSQGTILNHRHVSIPPTIEKNATIKIIMRTPGIEISGIAKALGEGKVGDTIEVRRQNENLKGTIIDPHTVLIQ
jgi:flagella basal body P-ring formation protein FlgA